MFNHPLAEYREPMIHLSKRPRLVDDRGVAVYFRGREDILKRFKARLLQAARDQSGTTILLQSATGAGKTALLAEFAGAAAERGWAVASIYPRVLTDPYRLSDAVENGWKQWRRRLRRMFRDVYLADHDMGKELGDGSRAALDVLRTGRAPLLLLLDEAQRLGDLTELQCGEFRVVQPLLHAIHHGTLGRPVILVASGLETTERVLARAQITEFEEDCRIYLGALDDQSGWWLLEDWFCPEHAEGDPDEWIDYILQATRGWPQFMMAHIGVAFRQIRDDGEVMTLEGLGAVLEKGREKRRTRLHERTGSFSTDELHCFARVLEGLEPGISVPQGEIRGSLSLEFTAEEVEEQILFAIHKGVLGERGNRFVIPIPTMHEWLVDGYADHRIRRPARKARHYRPSGFPV